MTLLSGCTLLPFLLAKANSEDYPTWEEAMNGPLKADWYKSCKVELDALQKKDSWEVVDRLPHMNVLPSTWAFHVKRYPSGEIQKLKARFYAGGHHQIQHLDFSDTFSHVVNWTTVRLMLILSQVLNLLSSSQVDYISAFVQSPIGDADVYIETPKGFHQDDKVFKLKQSLYGLKQSPLNFFKFLSSNLESIGFTALTMLIHAYLYLTRLYA
jgi:hypothetical protein